MTLAASTRIYTPEVPDYELNGFGLALGTLPEVDGTLKFHIFSDENTADFIVQAMRCQRDKPSVTHDLIFPKFVPANPDEGYFQDAYAAELKRGRRIVGALGETAIVAHSPRATARLLRQMVDMSRELTPYVQDRLDAQRSGLHRAILEQPILLWTSRDAHNALAYRGVTSDSRFLPPAAL